MRKLAAFAPLLVAIIVLTTGCGDAADSGSVVAHLTTLPSTLPVCDKNAAELLLFTSYDFSSCGGQRCPARCNSPSACPGGSTCDAGFCRPLDCTSNASVCLGDTICPPDKSDAGVKSCGLPRTCAEDNQCPCGSYCNSTTHACTMDCLTGPDADNLNLGCSSPLTCDSRGHCSNPGGSNVPSDVVTLTSSSLSVRLPHDANRHFSTASFTLQISTTSSLLGTQPTPVVTVSAPAAVSLSCAQGVSPTSGGCTVAARAFDLAGSSYVATQTIELTVADGATADGWDVTLKAAGSPDSTIVRVVPQAPYAQAGRYVGTLAIGSSSAPIPITATVTDTAIALHDSTRVIAPTGTILVPVDGTTTSFSFLAGKGTPQLYRTDVAQVALSGSPPHVDPVTGRLAGALTVSLATSPSASQAWSFSLARTQDLTGTPCPKGESYDTAVHACIPGVAWEASPLAPPSFAHSRANAWLNAMAPVVADPPFGADGAEVLAERLLCYDKMLAVTGLSNQAKTNGLSGDLLCANVNGAYPTWGVGLIGDADRDGATAPQITQFEMLAQCVAQLTKTPLATMQATGIDNERCVSLARFYPALFSLAGAGPYRFSALPGDAPHDQRSGLLFTRLVHQWSQLAGFVARNGRQQRGVADILTQLTPSDASTNEKSLLQATSSTLTYEALVNTVENAWTLLLDSRIQQSLLALPAGVVANPDYRQLHKPRDYWPLTTSDGANNFGFGPPLTGGFRCSYEGDALHGSSGCYAQGTEGALDHNVTLAVRVAGAPLPLPGTSTVFDSDGLVVRFLPAVAGPGLNGALLQVGHRVADGTVQLFPFSMRFAAGTLFITRDVRAKVYRLTTASSNFIETGTGSELVTRAVPYYQQPAVADPSIMVGASRAYNGSDYVRGGISQLAIWDSVLSPSELEGLAALYATTGANPHAIWQSSNLSLPSSSDPNANEAAVGLPVALLEGLIPTMGLVEGFVKNAALANPAACRRGNVDDGMQRARERAARALRVSYAVQMMADALHTRALTAGAPTWEARYSLAVAELQNARDQAIGALAEAERCQNPMGLGPLEFPLYFGESRDLLDVPASQRGLNVIEASALYLTKKAKEANTEAIGALNEARAAWEKRYTSGVQQTAANEDRDQRLDNIRSTFGREVVDLCGTPVGTSTPNAQNEITVLKRFLNPNDPNGHLTPQTCFVVETPACAPTSQTPLARVVPACLRGQIGEAILATESARQRVQAAIVARRAAQATQDAWFEHCAQKQDAATQTRTMIDAVTALEMRENDVNGTLGVIGGVASMIAGVFTGNLVAAYAGEVEIARGDIMPGLQNEKAALQAALSKRSLDDQLLDCWNQADLARIPMEGAEQNIVVASADLQASLAHVQTLQQKVGAVVSEAAAAIARESERPVPAIAFHYWADEALAIYQRSLERARRMSYLSLRAVEHDLQRNFGLDRDVLAATHPQQLKNIVDGQLGAYLGDGIDKLLMTQHFTVLSVCKDILRLPERNHEADCDTGRASQKQFRDILLSPRNALYENGTYVGQAIPFTLDPALGHVDARCAENLAQVDAHFLADNIQGTLAVELEKRETFYSRACSTHVNEVGGPYQVGTLRSSNNLLLDGTLPQFGQDREYTAALIDALKDGADGFNTSDTPAMNAVPDLAGRGLYGDYRLVVKPSAINTIIADTGDLRDIKIRLDYISVHDQPGPPPAVTAPLTVQLRDGDGQVLSSSANQVTASCPGGVSSCNQGSVAHLGTSAASGWRFAEWSGACAGDLASCDVTMNGPRQVFATFVDDDPGVALNVVKGGSGEGGVAVGWLGAETSTDAGVGNLPWNQRLPRNSVVTLIASPSPDAVFTGWSGGGCSGTGACVVTMSSAQTITASFVFRTPLTVQIEVDTVGQPYDVTGSFDVSAQRTGVDGTTQLACSGKCPAGSPASCSSYCEWLLDPRDHVTLTASAGGRYAFMNWAEACSGSGSGPCNLTMDAGRVAVAHFKADSVLSIDQPAHGLITGPNLSCGVGIGNCSGVFAPGTSVTLTASPASGYRMAGWTGAASGCGSASQCTLNMTGGPVHVGFNFVVIGGCTPGQTKGCCPCKAASSCCDPGQQTCNSSGEWGSCSAYKCSVHGKCS